MSAEETKVIKACNCITLLISEIKIVDPADSYKKPSNIRECFTADLRRNVHLTFHKIETYPDIKSFITEFIVPCLEDGCNSCDYLKFLQLCLVLLRILKNGLTEEAEKAVKKNDASKVLMPTGLLSISQKNLLQKCLQFGVALGILPNLLRGIGVPLTKRLRHAIILEHFTSESTVYQKHIQIAVCLDTLISCLECDAMQSTILSYHATDILAALLQLCHAPIKRVEGVTEGAAEVTAEDPPVSADSSILPSNEMQISNMMLAHRKYFTPHLDAFIKLICPSLLMWELLLFQGFPIQTEENEVVVKPPQWLRKICNQMLTDRILTNNGIRNLVQIILDKAFESDIECRNVDAVKMDSIARLISYNPIRHISLPEYIQRLSKQLYPLLRQSGSVLEDVLKFISSCIILQLCERDIKSAEQFLLVKLLKPLWCCVRLPANLPVNTVVKECDLTRCIENLHQIFIVSSTPLSRKYTKLLFPFSHCLCNMFFFLLKGKSYLKVKVKNLINNILKCSSDEDALALLHAVSFSNNKHCKVYITKVSFVNGDEGGIVAVQKMEEDFPDEIVRYHAILDLLSELQNKNLNRAYILLVLKEFCTFHLESKDNVMDPENIKAGILFNALLQELSEWNVDIGEALMSNISEVIDILMTLLESICNCRSDATFYEKTLWVVLMILNSILESDDQLTTSDWSSLKKCLPSLQKLQKSDIDKDLKEIIFSIIIHIATHGAACKNGIEIMKEFMSNFPEQAGSMKPSEVSLLDLVEKFDRECNVGIQSVKSKSPLTPSSGAASGSKGASGKKAQCEKNMAKHPVNPTKKSCSRTSKTDDPSIAKKTESCYDAALKNIKNPLVHIKGHGLLSLVRLVKDKNEEVLKNVKEVLNIFQENLEDEDSYIYLPSIQGLAELADIDTDLVLPVILNRYQNSEEKDHILKLGEALLKICNNLGDMIYKYRDELLHAYLVGTKRRDPQIRSSSLSNLGQACMCLKFNINGHWLQEILICVLSFLKTDPDIEVRRCAVMVIYLLLKGVGRDMIMVLKDEIKNISIQLKITYRDSDDVLRLHSQLAIEELNSIMKEMFTLPSGPMSKEIRILQ